MSTSDQSAYTVFAEALCQVEQEKLQAINMLLNELLPFVSIPIKEHLLGVYIVLDDQREAVINEILKRFDELG